MRLRAVFPVFVLICGLGATALATYLVQENLRVRNRQHLLEGIHQIEQAVESRMESYISLLRGGAGLFAASELVTEREFQRFYERLEIPLRYRGVQGCGYSIRIPAHRLNAVITRARQEGITNFHVWPDTPRQEYHAIIYLMPKDQRNRSAIGYDMFSEPVRSQAMAIARDAGDAAISGKVKLVQELSDSMPQPGFLLYLPVYQGGDIPQTLEQRRAKLQGFIYSPFRAGNLFSAMVPHNLVPGLAFAVWDGTNRTANALLYRSDSNFDPSETTEIRQIETAGRIWTFGFETMTAFGNVPETPLLTIPLLGIIASTLLFLLAYREGGARERVQKTANELFQQSEWLDVTLASIADAVITTDTFGRVEFMNSAAEEITGEKLEEARGKPIADFFSIRDEETGRPLGNPAEQVIRTGEVVRVRQHSVLKTRRGRERSVDPSAAPIRDRSGEIAGVVLVFRETTERRKYERRSTAQHALTAILSESRSLQEAIPRMLETISTQLQFEAAIWWQFDETTRLATAEQVWHGPDPRLEKFTRACFEFRPKKGDGMPGLVWSQRRPHLIADLSRELGLPRVPTALEAGLRGVLAFPVMTETEVYGALEFFTREPAKIDAELQHVFQGLGRQVGQFIQRKNSEQALAESEELYRAVSETAADGVIIIDEESRILAVNSAAERMFGYSASELCGTSITRLIPPRMHAAHSEGIKRFIATGQKKISWGGVEMPGLHRDGHELTLEISFGAAKRRGKYIFTGLLRDIGDRKRTEEAIRELNQDLELRVERRTAALLESKAQMETFTYTVAHDLRAPLRAMQGFGDALLDEYGKSLPPEGQDYLRRIMGAAVRMDNLIQDLLAYSQLSRSDLESRALTVSESIAATLAEHSDQISAKGATIHLDVPQLEVRAHPATFEHAVSNLISNALKFTVPGRAPSIAITAEHTGSFVRVSVQDNGIGIAPEHQERIFRIFERLHDQEAYPGTGIGLAIVKKGVERMGGRVGLSSTPDEGSRFWIDLPAAGKNGA